MNNYICKNCKCEFVETDQIGDIVCINPKSNFYLKFVEDEIPKLDNCFYFKKYINEEEIK